MRAHPEGSIGENEFMTKMSKPCPLMWGEHSWSPGSFKFQKEKCRGPTQAWVSAQWGVDIIGVIQSGPLAGSGGNSTWSGRTAGSRGRLAPNSPGVRGEPELGAVPRQVSWEHLHGRQGISVVRWWKALRRMDFLQWAGVCRQKDMKEAKKDTC